MASYCIDMVRNSIDRIKNSIKRVRSRIVRLRSCIDIAIKTNGRVKNIGSEIVLKG